jgi:hypothetical protein
MKKSQFISSSTAASCLLLLCVLSHQAASQSQQNEPQLLASRGYAQPHPVSLAHLYWHFLVYQHHLDQAAAERQKQGQDGTWLRDYLQKKLGFTDAEFAPIRTSADKLSAEIQDLNSKALTIAAADREARRKGLVAPDAAPPGHEQLKALTAEREADINAEIEGLDQALSQKNADALRTFLTQRFSQNVTALQIDRSKHPEGAFTGKPAQGSTQP